MSATFPYSYFCAINWDFTTLETLRFHFWHDLTRMINSLFGECHSRLLGRFVIIVESFRLFVCYRINRLWETMEATRSYDNWFDRIDCRNCWHQPNVIITSFGFVRNFPRWEYEATWCPRCCTGFLTRENLSTASHLLINCNPAPAKVEFQISRVKKTFSSCAKRTSWLWRSLIASINFSWLYTILIRFSCSRFSRKVRW